MMMTLWSWTGLYPDTEKPDFEQVSGEEDEETQINKYRALLQGITNTDKSDKAKNMDMEITWEPGMFKKRFF